MRPSENTLGIPSAAAIPSSQQPHHSLLVPIHQSHAPHNPSHSLQLQKPSIEFPELANSRAYLQAAISSKRNASIIGATMPSTTLATTSLGTGAGVSQMISTQLSASKHPSDEQYNSFSSTQARLRVSEQLPHSQLHNQVLHQQNLSTTTTSAQFFNYFSSIKRGENLQKEGASPIGTAIKKDAQNFNNAQSNQQESNNKKNARSLPRIREHLSKSNAQIEQNNSSISHLVSRSKQQLQQHSQQQSMIQLKHISNTLSNPSITCIVSPSSNLQVSTTGFLAFPSEANTTTDLRLHLGMLSDRKSITDQLSPSYQQQQQQQQQHRKDSLPSSFSFQSAQKSSVANHIGDISDSMSIKKKESPKKGYYLNPASLSSSSTTSLMMRKSVRDSQIFETSNASFQGLGNTTQTASTKKLQDFFVKRLHADAQNKLFAKKLGVEEQSYERQLEDSGTAAAGLVKEKQNTFRSIKPFTSTNSIPTGLVITPLGISNNSTNSSSTQASSSSFEEFKKSLHAEVSSAYSDAPRSRGDLKQIIEWFDRSRKRIFEEESLGSPSSLSSPKLQMESVPAAAAEKEQKRRRERQGELIHASFIELEQQIRMDFSERADFLRRVWDEHVSYYENFIGDFETMRLQLSINADSEYNRVHDGYRVFLKEKDLQVTSAQDMQRNAEARQLAVQKELEESQLMQKRFRDELNKFKKICFFLKKKLNQAMIELDGLRERQNDRMKYSKQQFLSDFYKDQLFQAKNLQKSNSSNNVLNHEEIIASLMEQLRLLTEEKSKGQQQPFDHNPNQQLNRQKELRLDSMHGDDEDDTEGAENNDSNFVFEYQDGGDVVQSIEALNAVVFNTEIETKRVSAEVQVEDDLRVANTSEMFAQTDLILTNNKFDAIMFDNETMNDVFDFYAYKQQMDEISSGKQLLFDEQSFDENNPNSAVATAMKGFFDQMNSIREEEEDSHRKSIQTASASPIGRLRNRAGDNNNDEDEDEKASGDDQSNSSSSSSRSRSHSSESKTDSQMEESKRSPNSSTHTGSAQGGYDDIKEFKQRASIRRRVSVSQNLFNTNRHLSLSLEQYLESSIVNESIAIFGAAPSTAVTSLQSTDRTTASGEVFASSPTKEGADPAVTAMLNSGDSVQETGKSSSNIKRNQNGKSAFSMENNPIMQKKRMQLKAKLNMILNPTKLKKVLDDAGLKVTSSQTESKLDKFLKIYQLSQFRGQELQVKLNAVNEVLEKTEVGLQREKEELGKANELNSKQQVEIARLEEELRILREKAHQMSLREAELMEKKEAEIEEKEEENAKNRGGQPRIFRSKKDREAAAKGGIATNAFNLGKKVNIEWEFQKQQNSGKVIVDRAKEKKMAKFNNFLTLKTLLKQIAMLYNERMSATKENSNMRDLEFANFAYNYYSSQYGVKKIADQKFLILVLSVKKYSQILRINLFSKFLGLQEPGLNYTNDEFNKYIDVLDFVNHISQAGSNYTNSDSEQRYLVPYIKAVHYISQFGDSRMKSEENAELRRDIEAMKLMDANKIAVVDFDAYMTRLLVTYRILVNRAKQYVINAFNACDLDGNRKCNFTEWSLLNRHIEPTKFDDDQLESVFEANADILDEDGEKNLSFDKFAVVSLEYEIFTDEAQNKYLGITSNSVQQSGLQLKEKHDAVLANWAESKGIFEGRFKVLSNIDADAIEEWLNIISVLDEKLSSTPFSVASIKPLLIAHLILDKESSMLEKDNLESQLNAFASVGIK